jgi:4-aminobutyrate aminotransferase-like enzyme
MVMAIGIANGFPLSCFITREKIADSFQPGDHHSTFGGNPVSCAASLANISFIQANDLPQKAAQKGEKLCDALKKINPKDVVIGDIRGSGLMIGIEVVKDTQSKVPASSEAKMIRSALREKGILIGVGGVFANVLRIQPPLIMTEEEIEKVIETLKDVLE